MARIERDEVRERRRSAWAAFELACLEAGEPFDVERYVLGRLEETFAAFPERIGADTGLLELYPHQLFEGGELGWLRRMEEELRVSLPKKARITIWDENVAGLVALLERHIIEAG